MDHSRQQMSGGLTLSVIRSKSRKVLDCASPLALSHGHEALGKGETFAAYWNAYVPQHLLPRLHAFELMMAPYAIAHMKIGLKLAETGHRFGTEERARIYLTNALEPKVQQLPQIGFDALAHEAAAVNEIKWYKRFTVVIGNPPYSLLSANLEPHHRALVEAYTRTECQNRVPD